MLNSTLHDNITIKTETPDDIKLEWQQGLKTFTPVVGWSHLQHYVSREALVFGTIYDKKLRSLIRNKHVCYVGEIRKNTTPVVSKNAEKSVKRFVDPEFVEYYIYNAAGYVLENGIWSKTGTQHVVNITKETFEMRKPYILKIKSDE